MMRNRWGIEIKRGHWVYARTARNGAIEGRIDSIDRTSDYAKAYGPQIKLDSGLSVGVDDVTQTLGPMKVTRGGVVKQNPVALSELSATELARLLSENYARRPSSAKRRFGSKGPTPAQAEAYEREVKANRSERAKLSAAHKVALARDNAAHRAGRDANPVQSRMVTQEEANALGATYAPATLKAWNDHFIVQKKTESQRAWEGVSVFKTKKLAFEYARALARARPTLYIRVIRPEK